MLRSLTEVLFSVSRQEQQFKYNTTTLELTYTSLLPTNVTISSGGVQCVEVWALDTPILDLSGCTHDPNQYFFFNANGTFTDAQTGEDKNCITATTTPPSSPDVKHGLQMWAKPQLGGALAVFGECIQRHYSLR
jgi:hypothetical protein